MESERNDGIKWTVVVNAVEYKEVKHWQTQIECHTKFEHEDVEQKGMNGDKRSKLTPILTRIVIK